MSMNKVNESELKGLYSKDPAAKAILDSLAGRQKNMSETKLANLYYDLGGKVTYPSILRVAKGLESIGAGKVMFGRRGGQTRIEWGVPLVNLGKLAAGEISDINSVPKVKMVEHQYMVRPGFAVRVELPSDLSQGEATRLGEFVKTLYFC